MNLFSICAVLWAVTWNCFFLPYKGLYVSYLFVSTVCFLSVFFTLQRLVQKDYLDFCSEFCRLVCFDAFSVYFSDACFSFPQFSYFFFIMRLARHSLIIVYLQSKNSSMDAITKICNYSVSRLKFDSHYY